MIRILTAALLFLLALRPDAVLLAHDNCLQLECRKTKQRIAKIESRMRRGYGVSAGEKMKDELRRLQRLRSRVCR